MDVKQSNIFEKKKIIDSLNRYRQLQGWFFFIKKNQIYLKISSIIDLNFLLRNSNAMEIKSLKFKLTRDG